MLSLYFTHAKKKSPDMIKIKMQMFCWLLPHELWVGRAGVLFSAVVDVIKLVPII